MAEPSQEKLLTYISVTNATTTRRRRGYCLSLSQLRNTTL
jgi:hypothetical protein